MFKKEDYPVVSFFDQVFDPRVNPKTSEKMFDAPLKYVLLIKLNSLFNLALKRKVWEASIEFKDSICEEKIICVCDRLIERLILIPDQRSREIFYDVLDWTKNNVQQVFVNAQTKKQKNFISPNSIGMQGVYLLMLERYSINRKKVLGITIDQQQQFNEVQGFLFDVYKDLEGKIISTGMELPAMDLRKIKMPKPIFSSSKKSVGLELVDIYLWLCKRLCEKKLQHEWLHAYLTLKANKIHFTEFSIDSIVKRWEPWVEKKLRE